MGSKTSKLVSEENNREEKEGGRHDADLTSCCWDVGMVDGVDVDCLDCCFQCLSLPFKLCLALCMD